MQRRSSIRLMRAPTATLNPVAGFSLIELMVAIALSLLLLAGVVAIFSSSRVSYESTEQLSRVQETGRFALDQMTRHIRGAGFSGCSRQPNFISTALNSSGDLQWDFMGSPVRGFNAGGGTWTPALDPSIASLTRAPVPNSDVLVVRGARLDTAPIMVTEDMAAPTAPLTVSNTDSVGEDGAVVMAYTCEGAAFFFASVSGSTLTHGVSESVPGNEVDSTSYKFLKNAEVVPVEAVAYYVAASTGIVPVGTNSLWRRVALNDPEELVQGVEQLQVEYGVDLNDDRLVDVYRSADLVGSNENWQRVIAVRVGMLVRSVEQYGTDVDTRTYQIFNNPVIAAAGDRRLREVFTTTVSIRNRVRIE